MKFTPVFGRTCQPTLSCTALDTCALVHCHMSLVFAAKECASFHGFNEVTVRSFRKHAVLWYQEEDCGNEARKLLEAEVPSERWGTPFECTNVGQGACVQLKVQQYDSRNVLSVGESRTPFVTYICFAIKPMPRSFRVLTASRWLHDYGFTCSTKKFVFEWTWGRWGGEDQRGVFEADYRPEETS